jgi:hypothetical protein
LDPMLDAIDRDWRNHLTTWRDTSSAPSH